MTLTLQQKHEALPASGSGSPDSAKNLTICAPFGANLVASGASTRKPVKGNPATKLSP